MSDKIKKLKDKFKLYGIDGYIIPKNDDYFTEYSKINRLKIISNFSGSAGLAVILKSKNYLLVGCTLTNLFFIDKAFKNSVLGDREIYLDKIRNDKKIKNIIFPGYDGSLHTTLPIDISWHKLKISNKKFQILPFFLRKFPDDYNIVQKFLFLIFREFLYPGRFIRKIINLFKK